MNQTVYRLVCDRDGTIFHTLLIEPRRLYFDGHGGYNMLTLCPSCAKMFDQFVSDFLAFTEDGKIEFQS